MLSRFAFYYYFYKDDYVPLWDDGVRLVGRSRVLPDDGVRLRGYDNL